MGFNSLEPYKFVRMVHVAGRAITGIVLLNFLFFVRELMLDKFRESDGVLKDCYDWPMCCVYLTGYLLEIDRHYQGLWLKF